jgi:aromatic ring-opening dioxygenase LigB subunit
VGVPTDKDVLFGRGERSNKHAGNKEYLAKVELKEEFYRAAKTDMEKRTIVRDIVKEIHDQGGRFLEKEEALPKRWFEAHPEEAFMKVAQAFRDKKSRVVVEKPHDIIITKP